MRKKTVTFFFKGVVIPFFMLLCFDIIAQEENPNSTIQKLVSKIQVSGSIDGYYRYNFDAPNQNFIAPLTSFVNQSGFAIGMANIIVSYEGEKTGFIADLAFGPRGEDAVFNSNGSAQVLNQLYSYWNATKNIKFTFGNFNTFLGYEVISPAANFNYSTSYMFSYGPFSHTGLKTDITLHKKWSVMLAVMNPTDYTENNPFDTYIAGVQIGYTADTGSLFLNFRYGSEGKPNEVTPTFQADLTTGWDLTKDFYLGINTTYLSAKPLKNGDNSGFYGAALYPQYKTSEKFTIGLRGEYFSVFNGGLTDVIGLDNQGDGDVIAVTLTGNYTIGDLILKPELRIDNTSEDFFINKDGETTKSLTSFVLGAIYKF